MVSWCGDLVVWWYLGAVIWRFGGVMVRFCGGLAGAKVMTLRLCGTSGALL